MMKVDVLALGMLTCIRKCFDLIADHKGKRYELATVEQDDAPTGATDTPTGATTTNQVNLWQSDSVGFKVTRRINFAKRRSGAVNYLANGEYGGVAS